MRNASRSPVPAWLPLPCEPPIVRVSVGNNEDAASSVGGAKVAGGNPQGARTVSELAEVPPHRGQPGPHAARDVLDDDEARPDERDDVREVVPEPRSGAAKPSLLAGAGDVLAGESSANNVNVRVAAGLRDILEPHDGGPVLREHAATEGIDLALPKDRPETGALEPELQAADAREQRADREAHLAGLPEGADAWSMPFGMLI